MLCDYGKKKCEGLNAEFGIGINENFGSCTCRKFTDAIRSETQVTVCSNGGIYFESYDWKIELSSYAVINPMSTINLVTGTEKILNKLSTLLSSARKISNGIAVMSHGIFIHNFYVTFDAKCL